MRTRGPESIPTPDGAGQGLARCHDDFLRALEDEVAETEARRRSDSIAVAPGQRLGQLHGWWRYQFEVPQGTGGLAPGREVCFETGRSSIPGVIVGCSDRRAVVTFHQDLGDRTATGRLVVDTTWLLIALRSRIESIREAHRGPGGARDFDFTSAARIIGMGDPSPRDLWPRAAVPVSSWLTTQQQRCVEMAARHPALYLWGPPGTGKTATLADLVPVLADEGLRVLFVAPTNLGVDDFLERAAGTCRARHWFRDGAVLRVGSRESVTLPDALRSVFCLDAVVMRHLHPMVDPDPDAFRREALRLLRTSHVVAATVHQSYVSPLLMACHWDVLVVDEASMISPIALYAAAGLARRTVVAGDFRQLAPICHSSSPAARAWLGRDAFQVVDIPGQVDRGDSPQHLVMLQEQHRMAPDICDLVSGVYRHQLVTHPSVLARPRGPLGEQGLYWIDSGTMGARVETDRSGSRLNRTHVRIVQALIEYLRDGTAPSQQSPDQVLVITPFRAQARLLDSALRRCFGKRAPPVRTIHRSQGREADLVILDLVDARNRRASRFLQAPDAMADGGRLLTVAVTRARQHLIVIADVDHLLTGRGVGAVVRRLVRDVTAHGRRFTVAPMGRTGRAA